MEELRYTEQDWKLFRRRIGEWQEAYMGRLNAEYVALLTGDGYASEKFWALEERIKRDKRSSGVIVEMRRSKLEQNLVSLLYEGVITQDDLEGFSDNLRDAVTTLCRLWD